MFKTEDDIGIWIAQNVKDKSTYHEVKDAVYWFVAMVEATNVSEQYCRKDLAQMLLGGTEKIQGNKEYVENFLGTFYEDEDPKEATQELTNLLRQHFGVKD